MESLIGLIIWVIVIIVIVSKTIRQAPVSDKKEKEDELKGLFETVFSGQPPEEETVPDETPEETGISEQEPQIQVSIPVESKMPEQVIEAEPIKEPVVSSGIDIAEKSRLKKYLPDDFRQAIILNEIIGPPKAVRD